VQIGLIEQNVIFIANARSKSTCIRSFRTMRSSGACWCRSFGNRRLLRAEERDEANNQYDLMQQAGIAFRNNSRRRRKSTARHGESAAR